MKQWILQWNKKKLQDFSRAVKQIAVLFLGNREFDIS